MTMFLDDILIFACQIEKQDKGNDFANVLVAFLRDKNFWPQVLALGRRLVSRCWFGFRYLCHLSIVSLRIVADVMKFELMIDTWLKMGSLTYTF